MQTPVVTLEKKGPVSISLGQPLVYEIAVRNAGAIPARQVRVEDELPAGTRLLASDPPAAVQGERLTWVVDGLAVGAERRFKVQVQPSADGEWAASASVTVAATAGLRTRVVRSNLGVTIAGPENVPVGQTAVFEIRVTNAGTQTLTGLVLRDRLPAGLQHPAGAEIEADLGTLEPGKTRGINLSTRAVQPGRYVNSAVVLTPDGQQVEAQATVQVLAARPGP
jgi:uncharacterized repeat protein (TIGR01451 family)